MLNSRLPKNYYSIESTSKSNVFPERWFDPTFAIFRDFHEFFQGFSQLLFSTNFFVYKFEFSFQLVSASPRSPGSPLSQDILVSVLSFSAKMIKGSGQIRAERSSIYFSVNLFHRRAKQPS